MHTRSMQVCNKAIGFIIKLSALLLTALSCGMLLNQALVDCTALPDACWHRRSCKSLLSTCPTLSPRLLAVATLAVPTAIFDRDVRPKKEGAVPLQGVSVMSRGDVAKSIYDGSLPITVNQCLCHAMTMGTA